MARCRPEIVRLHSDNTAELVSKTMCDEAAKRSHTEPPGNGQAESLSNQLSQEKGGMSSRLTRPEICSAERLGETFWVSNVGVQDANELRDLGQECRASDVA